MRIIRIRTNGFVIMGNYTGERAEKDKKKETVENHGNISLM